MSSNLTPEERETGRRNFQTVVGHHGLTRRTFMKGLLAAGAAVPLSAAIYFGYERLRGQSVKVGLIGAGDQGGVLVGEHNPDFLHFVGYCDPRPSNQERIFKGEASGPRKGLERIYGSNARKDVKRFDTYRELLQDKDIEAVVIAVPLHLHAQIAIDAMRAGKHVFCEKLMAWNVDQCKQMMRVSEETGCILAIGHQRHYSMLYAQALEVLDTLGTVRHIRTTWHRNNGIPILDSQKKETRDPETGAILYRDSWRPNIPEADRVLSDRAIKELGYKSLNELVRWRLYRRTSGGLMAELGGHVLDASCLFLGGARPLAVSGFGGKTFFHDDREVDDHVFATFEFPGPNYYAKDRSINDANDIVAVTFSSINTNASEPYGETLFGTNGTMIVESEKNVLLYPERGAGAGKRMIATVTTEGGGKPVLEASATTNPADRTYADKGKDASGPDPVSKGYREELEHFAFCVRAKDKNVKPRCDGETGLRDAVMALAANVAFRKKQRIEFRDGWFDANSEEKPD